MKPKRSTCLVLLASVLCLYTYSTSRAIAYPLGYSWYSMPSGFVCVGVCGSSGQDPINWNLNAYSGHYNILTYQYVTTNGSAAVFGNGYTGSFVYSPLFPMSAGDTLHIYYEFVTSDPRDAAWFALFDLQGNLITGSDIYYALPGIKTPDSGWFALGADSGACRGASSGCGSLLGGSTVEEYSVQPEWYYLQFGVNNVGDDSYNSGLAFVALLDDAPIPTNDTPEPSTFLLVSSGLLGLASYAQSAFRRRVSSRVIKEKL